MRSNLRSEQKIMKLWKCNKPVVSVLCTAYNHGEYIEDALEGFLIQETNFPFEILIHDDASTDNTADIIREYVKAYPNIIKPVFQSENQYSKGVHINNKYLFPKLQGSYIALCEGDDYWTDPLKLQKQFEAMEKHPEVDLCSHASIDIDARTKHKVGFEKHSEVDCILPAEDVIMGDGGFFATASLFGRKEIFNYHNWHKFRYFLPCDYTTQIDGALRGGVYYFKDFMSVYRRMASGSWSERIALNQEYRNNHFLLKIKMLRQLDKDTDGKYTKVIKIKIMESLITIYKYKELFSPEFRPYFKHFPFFKLVKYFIRAKIPYLAELKRQKDVREVLKVR